MDATERGSGALFASPDADLARAWFLTKSRRLGSKVGRRLFEAGALQVTEWTNAALAWRYRAAAMGIPFIPARVMLGTDTFAKSAAVVITCPYTGKRPRLALLADDDAPGRCPWP